MLYPFKLTPVYRETLWGGRNLEKLGKHLPSGKTGETFEVSTLPDGCSTVVNGVFGGISLGKLIELYPLPVMGFTENPKEFPLLFKLIDANDTLSVQVHPGNTYAKMHENQPHGKNEAWFILDARPGAQIIYGLKPDIDEATFSDAVYRCQLEKQLNYVDVFAGDAFDVPAGMVHAIGNGIMLAEIQQNSDLTYRLYDFNRKDKNGKLRPLQQKKALDVIDFQLNKNPPYIRRQNGRIFSGDTALLISNEYFVLELVKCGKKYEFTTGGHYFYIFFMVNGEAKLQYSGGELLLDKGQTVLIPACLGDFTLSGCFSALKMHRPDSKLL